MPTWRRSISQSYDKDNNSVYYDKFNETEYFKFFNNLINDERVLSVMREKGYTGKFALHPIHAKQIVDYQENDVFTTVKGKINYQELFSESALMITDFSSTFFDFCYLEKPIIYAQFDKEDFYAGQIYNEGYFGYEKNGFGPVCETYEDTVNTLINSINNDCVLDSEYEKRIKDFYAFNDNQNCQRIFDAIVNMDK
jgi:CDP-glycerol glycerophosphotransferase (TagB/SpsB family)